MEPRSDRAPRCAHCGDVIGVYEPMMIVEDGPARRTSLAAEPSLASRADRSFHGHCYEDGGRPPGADGG